MTMGERVMRSNRKPKDWDGEMCFCFPAKNILVIQSLNLQIVSVCVMTHRN